MRPSRTLPLATLVASWLFVFGAQEARAVACTTPPLAGYTENATSGADTTDVTFRGEAADSCRALYEGGNSGGIWEAVQTLYGSDLLQGPKSETDGGSTSEDVQFAPSGPVYSFSLSYDNDADDPSVLGTWAFGVSGDLPIGIDIVAVFKQATGWGAFLFESELFQVGDASGEGTFEIVWCPGGGRDAVQTCGEISHLSTYVRPSATTVPAPGSVALLGIGLAGLAWRRRRLRMR